MNTTRLVPCLLGLLLVACGGRVEEGPGASEGTEGVGVGAAGTTGAGGGPGGTVAPRGTAGGGGALPTPTAGVGGGPGDGPIGGPPLVEPTCDVTPPSTTGQPAAGCGCTRRPGPGNSPKCAMGEGESITVTVGPSGGTIVLWGRQGHASGAPFKLDIPAGALSADTNITLTETSFSPPSSFIDYSPVWHMAPAGLTFDKPVEVTMPWGNEDGTVGGSLASYVSADGCTWEKVPDSYVNAGFENASIVRLGYAFVGYPKTPAKASCP